jgi:hypothetical protein
LRLNRDGFTRGLCGQSIQVYHLHDDRKVIAFHRWDQGGTGDDVVVVANFFHAAQDNYTIGFPAAGTWKIRFNSDWRGCNDDFSNHARVTHRRARLLRRATLAWVNFYRPLQCADLFAVVPLAEADDQNIQQLPDCPFNKHHLFWNRY